MSDKPAFIHHVNFPTTNPERTIEWYSKVFWMKYIKPKSNTKVVLMTRGSFDLHFTPVETMDRMAPYHFAITRPENNSQFCYIHDPDHTMIELVFHARRPYPPVARPPRNTGISQTEFGNKIGEANSADEARVALAEGR